MRSRLGLLLVLLVGLCSACRRPVDLPPNDTFISDVVVSPEFARANQPIEITFQANGNPPASVSYEIANTEFPCEVEALGGGRMRCVNPGLALGAQQGVALVVVKATGADGTISEASDQIHLDFDCPTFISAFLSTTIASPGDEVFLTIEASEVLGEAPLVTRLGRVWGVPSGSGASWSLARTISDTDPAQFADIVIQLTDRAGNRSSECSTNRNLPFAVDRDRPVVNVAGVQLMRDVPGQPSMLSASTGSFIDDVGIARVELLYAGSDEPFASVEVAEDGSISEQSIGLSTTGRVRIRAVDLEGNESEPQTIRERWRVSAGNGATPGAAVKTAVRFSPAPPQTRSMHERTTELAPDIAAEDARSSVIRASVGFEQVGAMPSRYENSKRSIVGYDPVGKAMVVVGGYNGPDVDGFRFYAGYMRDVQIVRWDEREGRYITEQGPLLSYEDPNVPEPRFGTRLAFDDYSGCGIMFGSDALIEEARSVAVFDLWRICGGPAGYQWERINLPPEVDGNCIRTNFSPPVWDPYNRRFVFAGDGEADCGDTRVLFLEPGDSVDEYRWINVQPLPTNFGGRFNNMLYIDPWHRGFALGLGGVSPIGNGEQAMIWTYRNGQWTISEAPRALWWRSRFGWDMDVARRRLTIWGGSSDIRYDAEPEVWYLTDTSTNGPDAWRSARLDNPISREYPAMVYDSDREVMMVFGGVKWNFISSGNYEDAGPVPADIYQLVSQPSFPYMQVSADLGAARPAGIERMTLTVRAHGTGDGDGEGPGVTARGGIRVMLWDHVARQWDTLHEQARDPLAGFETIELEVLQDADRYIGPDGAVPITVVPMYPATEVLDGRLEVDFVEGALELRPGVTL